MSIASQSVMGRILAEVQSRPGPPELGARERNRSEGQLFELRRSEVSHEPPFATPLHFWAHALHDLLVAEGRSDLFEALAAHGLCRVEEPEAIARGFRALAGRVGSDAEPLEVTSGYRMLDRDVVASWLAESDAGFSACFWLRADWLASAAPWEPEDDEEEASLARG